MRVYMHLHVRVSACVGAPHAADSNFSEHDAEVDVDADDSAERHDTSLGTTRSPEPYPVHSTPRLPR